MHKGQVIKKEAYDWVKCANPNCNKTFPRSKRDTIGKITGNGVRGKNALTCGRLCSKIYTDIVRRRWKVNHAQQIKVVENKGGENG